MTANTYTTLDAFKFWLETLNPEGLEISKVEREKTSYHIWLTYRGLTSDFWLFDSAFSRPGSQVDKIACQRAICQAMTTFCSKLKDRDGEAYWKRICW